MPSPSAGVILAPSELAAGCDAEFCDGRSGDTAGDGSHGRGLRGRRGWAVAAGWAVAVGCAVAVGWAVAPPAAWWPPAGDATQRETERDRRFAVPCPVRDDTESSAAIAPILILRNATDNATCSYLCPIANEIVIDTHQLDRLRIVLARDVRQDAGSHTSRSKIMLRA